MAPMMKTTLFSFFCLISLHVTAQTLNCSPVESLPLIDPIILGNGTPGSVTQNDIQAALDQGGSIFIDQGISPTVISVTKALIVRDNVLLDGGGLVSLDGGNSARIIQLENPQNINFTLTLQNLDLINGRRISASGGAIFKEPGGPWQAINLRIINSRFINNHGIQVEQDGGGGALYATGLRDIIIANADFVGNSGSNGGAFYSLGSQRIKIVDSLFQGNNATGNSGNPGNGGNGGAMGVDGAEREVVICRTDFINNSGNAFGAGFFSVMYDTISLSSFTDVLFANNANPGGFGFAGGAYIQGGPFLFDRVSFIDNQADGVGALFLGPNANGLIVNSTFHGNIARTSLGGAMSIDGSVVASISHSTIVGNHAPGPVGFVGGIQVPAANQITLRNSILANNTGGNEFNPWNIRNPVNDGGGNLQFPRQRPNGQDEVPATPSVIWADPLLGTPADNGGDTPTIALNANSPAINAGIGLPSTPADQRGVARLGTSDAGAYEFGSDVLFSSGFE